MKSSLAKILYSAILTFSISTIVGLIFKSNFWYVFTLTTILQVIGFLILNQIYTNRLKQSLEIIKADQLREQNRNYVNVVCPCNEKSVQLVDIRFDTKPQYTCNKCNKQVSCETSVRTFTVTSPVYLKR